MPDSAREIENLLHVYAERMDAGDLEGVADLFAHGRVAGSAEASPEQMFSRMWSRKRDQSPSLGSTAKPRQRL